jgi:hypothetical protein
MWRSAVEPDRLRPGGVGDTGAYPRCGLKCLRGRLVCPPRQPPPLKILFSCETANVSQLRLPAFVRAGAILPRMFVDDQTKDVFNHRQDGSIHDELILNVYASAAQTQFTLYEDDGQTLAYDAQKKPVYQTRTTPIIQQQVDNNVALTIANAEGNYPGASATRANVVRLVVENANAEAVTRNGVKLNQLPSEADFNAAASGWYQAGANLILAKSEKLDVNVAKTFQFTLTPIPATTSVHFVCDQGWTSIGENIYVTGNLPALGNWNPAQAVKLNPSVYYAYIFNPPPNHQGPGPTSPKWTGLVLGLPANTNIEWKSVKQLLSGQWQWEPGKNNTIKTVPTGFSGTSLGSF